MNISRSDIESKAKELKQKTSDFNVAKSELIAFAVQDREWQISKAIQGWAFQDVMNRSLKAAGFVDPRDNDSPANTIGNLLGF